MTAQKSKPSNRHQLLSPKAGLVVLGLFAACSSVKEPLPPGFDALKMHMSLEALMKVRPNAVADGPGRYYDASGPIAFRIANQRVVGIRLLIPAPADKAAINYYTRHFKSAKKENYIYTINNHPLKLYASETGIEIIYGFDPGSANASLARAKAKKEEQKPARFPLLKVGRQTPLAGAAHYPVSRQANGIDIWLHPLGDPVEGPAHLYLIIGSGSADEASESRGSTSLVGALAQNGILALAQESHVRIEQLTLRTALLFSLQGQAKDVSSVAIALAKQLTSLTDKSIDERTLENAHAASLRQAMGTSLHRRILEDEGFAAIFAASSYSPSPVQRDQKIPSSEIVKQRAQALRNAPASIIVSGSVGPRYGYPIAEALKERKADTRLPALKPGLPNRESRKISNPALAIDGLWIDTSSITQIASLQLAKSLLEHQANQELRFKQNLSTGPLSVIAGGQIFAGYLMMINVTQGSDAQGIGLTSRSILSHLTNAMPTGAHFEDLRAGAIAKLSTQLASPQTATELMVDFRLMGARTPWIEQVIARMHNISSKDLETFLSKHASATHTFSVRWGPNQ